MFNYERAKDICNKRNRFIKEKDKITNITTIEELNDKIQPNETC